MIKQFLKLSVLLLALSTLLIACGESDDEEELHVDADGFILKVDDNQIYRQFQGTPDGGINLKVGEELEVVTVFIDHNGYEITIGSEEDDHDHAETEGDDHEAEEAYGLALSEYDSSIIEVHLPEGEAHEDDHDDDEEHAEGFIFEVVGRRAGQTGIKLELMHGDHPDFTGALKIPVTVSP